MWAYSKLTQGRTDKEILGVGWCCSPYSLCSSWKVQQVPNHIIWLSALFTLSRLSSLVGVRERDLCPLSPAPLRCQHRPPSQPTPHNTLIGKNTFHSAVFSLSPLSTQHHHVLPPSTAIHIFWSLTQWCASMPACLLFHIPPFHFYQDWEDLIW